MRRWRAARRVWDNEPLTTLVLLLAACLGGPPLVVGLAALGVPWQLTAAMVLAVAGVVFWRTLQQARAVGVRQLQGAAVVAALTVLGAATFCTARLSVFMLDETRADLSVLPNRPFFRMHSCLSAYTEAARMAADGTNIFAVAPYNDPARGENMPRMIGPFEVDLYQYPPAFLSLPKAALAATGGDFFTIRRLWFAVQSLVLLAAMVVLARWIGGPAGVLVLLLVPVVWLAPTTRVALQIGNFQVTAFPLAILAMVAFAKGRAGRGGLALGFPIASKIFPGLLGVLLLERKEWRAIASTVLWAVAFTGLAWLLVGSAPFVDFVRFQLPRIESGEAFFWMNAPEMAPVNLGLHGLVIKLRHLGVPFTGPAGASRVATVYALLLLALAWISARRLRQLPQTSMPADRVRLRHAQVWLALLSLASFRSPFVPDAYALVGTLWLLTLIAAEGQWKTAGRLGLIAAAALSVVILDGGVIPVPVPAWILLATLLVQIAAITLNVAIALMPGRGAMRAPATA